MRNASSPIRGNGSGSNDSKVSPRSWLSSSSTSSSGSVPVMFDTTSSSSLLGNHIDARLSHRARRSYSPSSLGSQRSSHARHPGAGPSPFPVSNSISVSSEDMQQRMYQALRERLEPFPSVRLLPNVEQKRILVTGGAGFLGSHLVDRLMLMGHNVLVLDNFFTGQKSNLSHWVGHPNFEMVRHDVVNPIMIEVDQIYHLACPASPPHYQANQIKTIKTNFLGTSNMLGLAKRTKARFLLASTSEVYGDPEVSPQKESYNGNVNQTGPRACYDEGKRVAETLTYGYLYQDNVEVRVARIFNTYGPRMNPYDGRVMSNFLLQALKGEPITIYGDGSQTRSFCYIEDLVDGLIALMNIDNEEEGSDSNLPVTSPVNLGSGEEFTIRELVNVIREVLGEISAEKKMTFTELKIEHVSLPVDDPKQRKPDITRAKELLDWSPVWKLKDGVKTMALSYLKSIEDGRL
ncbi:hypothetical protein CBS101457_004198 [Exobasidium rhododendri]|nr:hypothetical protein CBS101457_004198 [Exobasidium rhododendri]